jgi:mediator of RNA polymerase II transcription subunit 21
MADTPAELLTALQDQINGLGGQFFEFIGVLQRDAPAVPVSEGEGVLSGSGVTPAGYDVPAETDRMAKQLMGAIQATQRLISQLPDDLVQDEDAHYAHIRQLQQQDAEASQQLTAAVAAAEQQLALLQRLYAQLAQAELQRRLAAPAKAEPAAAGAGAGQGGGA